MHQHRQRADRGDLFVFDLEIDRHRLFQIGAGPAAGAEAVRPAEHHQAGTHLLGVAHQHFDLGFAEIFARHVAQQHRVERLQLRQRGEQLVAGPDRDLQILFPQSIRQKIEFPLVFEIFDQQHLPLAADVREGGGPVVGLHRILSRIVGNEPGFVGVEIGRVDFFPHAEHYFAGL